MWPVMNSIRNTEEGYIFNNRKQYVVFRTHGLAPNFRQLS